MSPSKRLDFQTLFEVFQNPFEMFGCKAFAHIPKDERIKLMQNQLSAYLLATILIKNHTSCLIPVHINCLQVEMWYFMRM